jgi:hypothetical protein
MTSSTPGTATSKDKPHPEHTVTVHVNNKPVEVPAPKATGREIKAAAIAAGVKIQADFVLSEELPNGKSKIVGDDDSVTVNPQSRFLAIAPDDNS